MSTIFVLLLCNANFIGTHSAPLPRHPKAQQTTHWAAAPVTRGTFGLLVSCVLTLVLCLWTSLHLNVPKQNETSMARAGRKLMWTLLALFAPELVVYAAWTQWVSAKMLCIEANKVLPVDVCVFLRALDYGPHCEFRNSGLWSMHFTHKWEDLSSKSMIQQHLSFGTNRRRFACR